MRVLTDKQVEKILDECEHIRVYNESTSCSAHQYICVAIERIEKILGQSDMVKLEVAKDG